MARIKDIVGGLQILQKHCNEDAHIGGADHDVVYAPEVDPEKLTEDERVQLEKMGWLIDEDGYYYHFC